MWELLNFLCACTQITCSAPHFLQRQSADFSFVTRIWVFTKAKKHLGKTEVGVAEQENMARWTLCRKSGGMVSQMSGILSTAAT